MIMDFGIEAIAFLLKFTFIWQYKSTIHKIFDWFLQLYHYTIVIIIIINIIIIIVLRKFMGKPWGFSAKDAILCQNGRMSHEKQWNDLQIYVESGVNVYPQPPYTIPLVGHGQGLEYSCCSSSSSFFKFFQETINLFWLVRSRCKRKNCCCCCCCCSYYYYYYLLLTTYYLLLLLLLVCLSRP